MMRHTDDTARGEWIRERLSDWSTILGLETDLAELCDPGWTETNRWDGSPNLLWPDDHAWFLASEIEFDSTLIGGSRTLIDDLLGSDGLEVAEPTPDAPLRSDADTITVPSRRPRGPRPSRTGQLHLCESALRVSRGGHFHTHDHLG